jgi:hypothetical protein
LALSICFQSKIATTVGGVEGAGALGAEAAVFGGVFGGGAGADAGADAFVGILCGHASAAAAAASAASAATTVSAGGLALAARQQDLFVSAVLVFEDAAVKVVPLVGGAAHADGATHGAGDDALGNGAHDRRLLFGHVCRCGGGVVVEAVAECVHELVRAKMLR